jgi:hypothetical protein
MCFHMQASFSSSQHAGCRIHVMNSTQHTRSLFDKTDKACSVLGLCYEHAARTSCIALIKRVMCTSAVPACCTGMLHAAAGPSWGATCPARNCSEAEACARWHTCPHAATLDVCLPIMASHCLTSHSDWQPAPVYLTSKPGCLLHRCRDRAGLIFGMHLCSGLSVCTPARPLIVRHGSSTAVPKGPCAAWSATARRLPACSNALCVHNCAAANEVTAATKRLHAAMQPLTRGGALRLERC